MDWNATVDIASHSYQPNSIAISLNSRVKCINTHKSIYELTGGGVYTRTFFQLRHNKSKCRIKRKHCEEQRRVEKKSTQLYSTAIVAGLFWCCLFCDAYFDPGLGAFFFFARPTSWLSMTTIWSMQTSTDTQIYVSPPLHSHSIRNTLDDTLHAWCNVIYICVQSKIMAAHLTCQKYSTSCEKFDRSIFDAPAISHRRTHMARNIIIIMKTI